jgi:hypothetical protein
MCRVCPATAVKDARHAQLFPRLQHRLIIRQINPGLKIVVEVAQRHEMCAGSRAARARCVDCFAEAVHVQGLRNQRDVLLEPAGQQGNMPE